VDHIRRTIATPARLESLVSGATQVATYRRWSGERAVTRPVERRDGVRVCIDRDALGFATHGRAC